MEAVSKMAEWSHGFPEKRGMYFVELSDGEHIVTPWEDGKSYCEAEGEYRKRGWTGLRDWSGRVVRWCSVKDITLMLNPLLGDEEMADG